MRVLVTGASGYVGSRLVPHLVEEGHDVLAAFRDVGRAADGWWSDQVDVVPCDVLDPDSVMEAAKGVDAVYYLVHGMADGGDLLATEREAAVNMRAAVNAHGVRRVVYLSGLMPDVPDDHLSMHLRARRETERILSECAAVVITLRAGIVLGSGSASFEIIRQLTERVPVMAMPPWSRSLVQPIAITDALEVLAAALTVERATGHVDMGGPDVLSYAELVQTFADVAGITRPQVPVPGVVQALSGKAAARLVDVPEATVAALVQSMGHDMVCDDRVNMRAFQFGYREFQTVDEAILRALEPVDESVPPAERDPMSPMPGDPAWAGGGSSRWGDVARCATSAVTRAFSSGGSTR